ncbi:MAG: hypothetical protein ACKOUT_00755 [Novosphingobium sp.]
MNDPIKPITAEQRQKVIRQRNVALGLVLGALAVLFFAITIAKM